MKIKGILNAFTAFTRLAGGMVLVGFGFVVAMTGVIYFLYPSRLDALALINWIVSIWEAGNIRMFATALTVCGMYTVASVAMYALSFRERQKERLDKIAQLKLQLKRALESEQYELAAKLRDEIKSK